MKLYAMEDTREAFAQSQKEPIAIILAADQSPSNTLKSIIVNFFNEQIGFIHGPEAYASKTKTPVVFFDVQRIKRGYYTLEIQELYNPEKELKKGELTQEYARKIEEIIRKKPEDWLWSHKRWKRDYSHHPDYKKT
jgi:KDO2-lipid IV(A) lauroyltransferase